MQAELAVPHSRSPLGLNKVAIFLCLVFCFFFPGLFALILEELCTGWSSGLVPAWHRLPRDGCVESPSLEVQHGPEPPAAAALGQELGADNPQRCLQPQPSRILWKAGRDSEKVLRGTEELSGCCSGCHSRCSLHSFTTAAGAAPVLCLCPPHVCAIPRILGEQDLRDDSL